MTTRHYLAEELRARVDTIIASNNLEQTKAVIEQMETLIQALKVVAQNDLTLARRG